MELKQCSKCGEAKNINAFAKNQWQLKGAKRCSVCMTKSSGESKRAWLGKG